MNMIKTMNKPLTYDDIPKMYLFCNHTKCPRRNKCLRFQAAMIVPQSVPHYEAININHVAGNEKECSYFSAYTLTTLKIMTGKPQIVTGKILAKIFHRN